MTIEDGARLRADWSVEGKRPCVHDTLCIELSTRHGPTGAYICTGCGELFKCRLLSVE